MEKEVEYEKDSGDAEREKMFNDVRAKIHELVEEYRDVLESDPKKMIALSDIVLHLGLSMKTFPLRASLDDFAKRELLIEIISNVSRRYWSLVQAELDIDYTQEVEVDE